VFKANNRDYKLNDVVDRDVPESDPYLLLESMQFEKNSSRNIQLIIPHLASINEVSVFKMGRGHESEIRVQDISVSRCHTLVKYNRTSGTFSLEDNLSKFGTLIINRQQEVDLEKDLTKAV
jgi:hypothetical protein